MKTKIRDLQPGQSVLYGDIVDIVSNNESIIRYRWTVISGIGAVTTLGKKGYVITLYRNWKSVQGRRGDEWTHEREQTLRVWFDEDDEIEAT